MDYSNRIALQNVTSSAKKVGAGSMELGDGTTKSKTTTKLRHCPFRPNRPSRLQFSRMQFQDAISEMLAHEKLQDV
eukprot:CAMPEP_0198221450 /NCGR_PEP_ID=MMETSP1445-20131203/83804_1 /TAXON_ID=36898 /ORGANISM="Pyramimonas sp., Strain CCMP2087" /LENGTH=75 /DNA_ID=CAMNT_0043899625 /DNA_START=237 /DNA_END=464 /DNA_ORIENTATION=+